MLIKTILKNFKSKLTKQVLNDFSNDCDAWYQSEGYDELVQAYKDAEENFKFGNVA